MFYGIEKIRQGMIERGVHPIVVRGGKCWTGAKKGDLFVATTDKGKVEITVTERHGVQVAYQWRVENV